MTELESIKSKIFNFDEIENLISLWKNEKQTIVFTNGCFDVLHYGHVCYLSKAKDLGNKLIMGLNSDSSVKRLKGPCRPINKQNERAVLLSALKFVDAVVIFDEDTPEKLIHIVHPDVLVKGGDYTFETIVGASFVSSYGGLVTTIPLVENFSSTNIINRL